MTREPPEDLRKTLERLDDLLARTEDLERLRMGMGIRLALGMAQELREGAPLGSQTAGLVAAWTAEHGQDAVDRAVQIAREFLLKPEELRKALGRRLGRDRAAANGGEAAANGGEAAGDGGEDAGDGGVASAPASDADTEPQSEGEGDT